MIGDGHDGSLFWNQREIASGNQRMNVERGQSAFQNGPVPVAISQAVKKALESIQHQEPLQRAFDRRGQFRTEQRRKSILHGPITPLECESVITAVLRFELWGADCQSAQARGVS